MPFYQCCESVKLWMHILTRFTAGAADARAQLARNMLTAYAAKKVREPPVTFTTPIHTLDVRPAYEIDGWHAIDRCFSSKLLHADRI